MSLATTLNRQGRGHGKPRNHPHHLHPRDCYDSRGIAVVKEDGAIRKVLGDPDQSKYHQLWALLKGTELEDRPRYTLTTTFATFPFPSGLTLDTPLSECNANPLAHSISVAAQVLNTRRENWSSPAELVHSEPEVVPGYPDRILPVDDKAAVILKKRTLTNLYNERPTWLDNAHHDLDDAVAAAYGWPSDLDDDGILRINLINLSWLG